MDLEGKGLEICRVASLPQVKVLETARNFKKDVKIEGTNSISPLASTKVSKNELKNARNEVEKRAEIAQKSQKEPYSEGDSLLRSGPLGPGLRSLGNLRVSVIPAKAGIQLFPG